MLTITFAMRTDTTSDPLISRILAMAMEFNYLTGKLIFTKNHPCTYDNDSGPLANPVDFVEPLQWLPNRMHARAVKLHDDFIEVYGSMVTGVKKRMDAGEDVPHCLAKVLIESQEREKLDWEDVCMLCTAFALGGVHSVRLFDICIG